jgi:type I restriction enzyme S subunit
MSVPKLRFPEFLDAGEWEEKKLGDICSYTKGFAFKSVDYKSQGVRIVRVSDLDSNFIKINCEQIFISEDLAPIYDRYKLLKGDIIITTVGSKPELVDSAVGRAIYVSSEDQGLLNQNLLKLEVSDELDNRFLFLNINTSQYTRFITSISRGNANQANIAVKELLEFKIMVPLPSEQQKIADCLSSLDDRITAETQKLDTLKAHKKGLMQQLFPAEGETLPKLRFPEFHDLGEWEEKRLGDITEKISDGIHSTPIYNENGQYYFVNGNNLAEDKIVINESTKRVDEIEYSKYKTELSSQTILISINGTIGNLAFFNGEKVVLGKSACYINLKPNENKYFVFNLLKTSSIQKYFEKELTGSTIKNLSLSSIKNAKAFFPIPAEQEKIADCLTSIDEAIAAQNQAIDLLKLHKKGLMQQLFPSVEEVRG